MFIYHTHAQMIVTPVLCTCNSILRYLSMSVKVEDSRKLLGAAVLSGRHDSRVRVPPVDGEPVKPHV